MSDFGSEEMPAVEIDFVGDLEEVESSVELPMSEWSSLEIAGNAVSVKKKLAEQGLYSPGSGELCAKYVPMSDSDIARHVYYKYPPVENPGIHEALLDKQLPIIYPNDGQLLYLDLCKEWHQCPVRLFYKNLLNSEIDLKYYGANSANVSAMAKALEYNKTVLHFNLTDNYLNTDACYHLGRMLVANTTLKELTLAGCRIGPQGLTNLGDRFNENSSLVSIDLSGNMIGEDGGEIFAKQLMSGANVRKVNLSRNSLGMRTSLAMYEALPYRNIMTHLDLSWNNFFHQPSMCKFMQSLSESTSLEYLNLAWNALDGDRVAAAIANVMLIPTMRVIDLSNNKFHDESVISILVSQLLKAKKLQTLDLSYNPLSPNDAVIVIQTMMKPRVKLTNLLLEDIWVNKKFMKILANVMNMKSRKDFKVKFAGQLQNYTLEGPDARLLLFRRMDYLGRKDKKKKADIGMFFLKVCKDYINVMFVKDMIDRRTADNVPLDDDVLSELASVFPGPKHPKGRLIDMAQVAAYVKRFWPDKQLPPTPPPEPEPEPAPEPEPEPKKKGKGKKK